MLFPVPTMSKKFRLILTTSLVTLIIVGIVAEPSHAFILDAARNSFGQDLTDSGFEGESGIELFFGFLEFLMLAIPIATGLMGLSQMNRGPEAWLPWFSIMGGSIVFIAFTTVVVNRVYGGGGEEASILLDWAFG